MTKTYLPKLKEIKREWHEIDAAKFTLGRLATRVATILRGKHKVAYTPHMDMGDFVVVTNAKLVKFTGRKLAQKKYFHFSGFPGGLKKRLLGDVMAKSPDRVIWRAVRDMLAANRLRSRLMKRLKILPDAKHTYHIDKQIEA